MRTLVQCAVLMLVLSVSALANGVTKEGDVWCGQTWITFPVIGYNLVTRKNQDSDRVIWHDNPHILTRRKSEFHSVKEVKGTWAVLLKGSEQIVYGVSKSVRMSLILCLN